jgi:hypothetical protein
LDPAALEPILPDRAGVPFTFTKKLRMVGKVLPRISGMYRNRPSVVDARIVAVRLAANIVTEFLVSDDVVHSSSPSCAN